MLGDHISRFIEGEFWLPAKCPNSAGVTFGGDSIVKSKEEDPNWRENWKWVVLETDGPTHIYFNDGNVSMRHFTKIHTKYVGVQIGPVTLTFHASYGVNIKGVISTPDTKETIRFLLAEGSSDYPGGNITWI